LRGNLNGRVLAESSVTSGNLSSVGWSPTGGTLQEQIQHKITWVSKQKIVESLTYDELGNKIKITGDDKTSKRCKLLIKPQVLCIKNTKP
jgi:hypothetical protein